MTSTPSVKLGLWTNYEVSPRLYNLSNVITTTDTWGTNWKIFLGVVFGLSWSCAKAIIKRIWLWVHYWVAHMRELESAGPETESLLPSHTSDPLPAGLPADSDESEPRALVRYDPDNETFEYEGSHSERSSEHNNDHGISTLENEASEPKAISWWPQLEWPDIILGLLGVAFAVAGGAIGELQASPSALSDTQPCGFWDLKNNADQRIKDNDDLLQAKKEERSAQYGRSCYGEQPIANPDQCDFFESAQIDYEVEKIDCPFSCPNPDRCICANGIYGSAVRLSTGLFSAKLLGLNGAALPQIKRTSIYVPLDIDYGFVVDRSGYDFEFEYHLGPVNASGEFRNHTFTMFGTPFNWDVPAYSVSAYESTPSGGDYDAWQPTSDLARPSHTYMTAMFISPCRIIYSGRCEDPIFLATDELQEDGWPPHRFYNQDPRARVLIAIDQMEVCPHGESDCHFPDEEYPEFGVEYEITRTALRRSSSFRSIEYRLGSALVATESISDFESRQLDKEQWIIESKALFNTSLARLQFNALDIAMGDRPVGNAAAGYADAYEDTTPSWARGRMCGKYKFHLSRGYTNIHVAHIFILLVPVSLYILSRETKRDLGDSPRPFLDEDWLLVDAIIWYIIGRVHWCSDKLGSLRQRLQTRQ
ncbi:hypothetical protein BKA67DRAFT_6128 [Truncatella angustata]|uniref:Uncharacterized protein n=1 Tax=Truncatella angustata TaxID=152316 RepID=A0A9P9A271_9PEZI|nr:uncharacterized protein BKA67DRAFT_6128 [Truncatella angustata]KAH6659102.1 hypothetical protein BKA67DRAFT_6128 [Truncatella angustata]KAH8204933.1 hypothetical protein TruAng_000972 [Truncatella angustata]